MQYIIMCGGKYDAWETPRQLTVLNGETLVERTIRLLKQNNVTDIAISATDDRFKQFKVPVLHHDNPFHVQSHNTIGCWVDAFYLTDYPVCYLFGDVVYSPEAVKKIVETDTTEIEFFASAPPFSPLFPKEWAEPFALKVNDTKWFEVCVQKTKAYYYEGLWNRHPIVWELWQVIKQTPLNHIDYTNYVVINDYTCDIDEAQDIEYFRGLLEKLVED